MSFSRSTLARFNEISTVPKECRSEYRHLYQLLGFCVFGDLSEWARSRSEILTYVNVFRILASSLRSTILTLTDNTLSGIKYPFPGKELIETQQSSLQRPFISKSGDQEQFQTTNVCMTDMEMKSYRPVFKEDKMGKKDGQSELYTKRAEASEYLAAKSRPLSTFGLSSSRTRSYVLDHNIKTLESQFEAKRRRFTLLKKELHDKQKTALQLYNSMAELREKLLNATGKDMGVLEEVKMMDIGQLKMMARSREHLETRKQHQQQMQDVAVGEGLLERSMWTTAKEISTCEKTISDSSVSKPPPLSETLLEWEEKLRSIPTKCLGMCRQVVTKRNLLLTLITGLAEDESGDGLSLEAEVRRQLVDHQQEADNFDKELEEMQENQLQVVSELVGIIQGLESVPQPLKTEQQSTTSERPETLKEENEETWELQDQIDQLTEKLTKEKDLRAVLTDETKLLEMQLKKTTLRLRDVENKLLLAENMAEMQIKQNQSIYENNHKDDLLVELELERDLLERRVSELVQDQSRMENEATVVISELERKIQSVNNLLEEKTQLSERLNCDLQDVRERLTEVENSITQEPKTTADRETQIETDISASSLETSAQEMELRIELQSVNVLLRSANCRLMEIEEENLRLQNTTSLSEEREQYLERKVQNIVAELRKREEQLDATFKDNKMLKLVVSYNQQQFKEYERRVSNLYAKAGSVMTQDGSTKQLQLQLKRQAEDLHRTVESLQSKLKVVESQNEELEQNVVHRQLEVELRDRALRRQTRALRARDEQLVGLKSALEKKEGCTQQSCAELASKKEELHSLYLTLEFKEDQVQRLEKQVKQLEEKKALQECELQLRRANHKARRIPREMHALPSEQAHYSVNSSDKYSNYSRNNVYGREGLPVTRYRQGRPRVELGNFCDGMRFRNDDRALHDGRGKRVSRYHSQIIIPTRSTNTNQDIKDPIVFTSDGLIKYIPLGFSGNRQPVTLNYSTNTLDQIGNRGDFALREKGSTLVTKVFYVNNTDGPIKDKIDENGNSVMRSELVDNINHPTKYLRSNKKADIAVEPVRYTTDEKLHLHTNTHGIYAYDTKINTPMQPVMYESEEELYPHSHSSDGYINDYTTNTSTHGCDEQCHIPIKNRNTDTKSRTEEKSVIDKNDKHPDQYSINTLRRINEDQPSENFGLMNHDERQIRSWPYCSNVVPLPRKVTVGQAIPATLSDEIEREPVKMNPYREVMAQTLPVYPYRVDVNPKNNLDDNIRMINNLGISRSLSPYNKFQTKVNSEDWLQRKSQLARSLRMRKIQKLLAENRNKFLPVKKNIKNVKSNIYEGKSNMQLNSGCDFKPKQTLDEDMCGFWEKRTPNSTHSEKNQIILEPIGIGDGYQECAGGTFINDQKEIIIPNEEANIVNNKMRFEKFLDNFWLDPNRVKEYKEAKLKNTMRNMNSIKKTLVVDSDPILRYSKITSKQNITNNEECKSYNDRLIWPNVITQFVQVGNKQKLCIREKNDKEREKLAKIIPFVTEPKNSHINSPIKIHDNLHAEKECIISKENSSGTNNHFNNILHEEKKEEQNPIILLKRDAENDKGSRPSRSLCKYTVRSTHTIRDDSSLRQQLPELKTQAPNTWPYHETTMKPQLLDSHLQNTNQSEKSSHKARPDANQYYSLDNSVATETNDTSSHFETLPRNTTKDSFKSSTNFNKQFETLDQDYWSNLTAQLIMKDQSLNELQPKCDYQHLQTQLLAPNTTIKKPQSDTNNTKIQLKNTPTHTNSQAAKIDNLITNQKPTNDTPISSDTTNKKSCFHGNINRKPDKPKQISWGNKVYYLNNEDISYNNIDKLSNSTLLQYKTTPNLPDVASVTNMKSQPDNTKSTSCINKNENLVHSENESIEYSSGNPMCYTPTKPNSKTDTSHESVNTLNRQSKISNQSTLSSKTEHFLKEFSQKELDSILKKLNVTNTPSKQILKNIQDEAAIHTHLSWIQMQETQDNDSQWADDHQYVYPDSHTCWPSYYEDPGNTEYRRERNCRGHWIVQQTLTDYSSSIESETEFYCSMPQCPCVYMYDTDVPMSYRVRRALNVSTRYWEACGY